MERKQEITYTPSELSKILDVSTNTIRRFEEMGYLSEHRNVENGYRSFAHGDFEKLMYVNKYRDVGFSHKEIVEILDEDIASLLKRFEERKADIDNQIQKLQSISHMLKDDINLIKRVTEYDHDYIERDCSPVHYVTYMKKGELCLDKAHVEALHRFMSTIREYKNVYLFHKEDVEAGILEWDEAIVSHHIMTKKYGVDISPPVENYEKKPCVLKVVRVPIETRNERIATTEDLKYIFYYDILSYMEKKGYILDGDVMGVKMGTSKEEGEAYQYMLLSFPYRIE